MKLTDVLSPAAYRRLAVMALGCLRGGRWYLVPEEESAPFVRQMAPEVEFVSAMDAPRPTPHGPRPWLVFAYDPEERSPIAMVRPGSAHSWDGRGITIPSHEGRHDPEETKTCALQGPGKLIPGCYIPLDVTLLAPERFSCTEPEFAMLLDSLQRYQQAHAPRHEAG